MNEQLDRIEAKLRELEVKLDATHTSAQRTYKVMLWTGIITAACIIIPMLLLPLFIPAFLASQGVGVGF